MLMNCCLKFVPAQLNQSFWQNPGEHTSEMKSLYQLANYNGEGLLLRLYEAEGKFAVLHYLQQILPDFIVQDPKLDSSSKNSLTPETDSKHFQYDGQECHWRPDKRGDHGETLLHILIISNEEIHIEIARLLMQLYPPLAKDVMLQEQYFGVSSLHLAIAYHNYDLVKDLLKLNVNVNQKVTGSFFNSDGNRYLGEYPSCWAACNHDKNTYSLLLEHGADPNLPDRQGNTVLHVLVIGDCRQIYGFVLKHSVRPADGRLVNAAGFTPLQLACSLGRNVLFHEIAELNAQEFWSYSRVKCCGYMLNELDSIQIEEKNGKKVVKFCEPTALNIILKGNSDQHVEMLRRGLIQKMLEEKWKTYGHRKFIHSICMSAMFLLSLSLAVFLREHRTDCSSSLTRKWFRYVMEILVCMYCIRHLLNHAKSLRHCKRILKTKTMPEVSFSRSIFHLACLLIVLCIPCRLLGKGHLEESLLVIALPCAHLILVFHASAVRLTGPFVSMIRYMLLKDMTQFSIIYLLFLYAFSLPFYFLLKQPPGNAKQNGSDDSIFDQEENLQFIDSDYAEVYRNQENPVNETDWTTEISSVTAAIVNIWSNKSNYADIDNSKNSSLNDTLIVDMLQQSLQSFISGWQNVTSTMSPPLPRAEASRAVLPSGQNGGSSSSFLGGSKTFGRSFGAQTGVMSYATCWMSLFKMTLGNHNHRQLRSARFAWLTLALFVLFIILVPILLLNMLIAMMGNTYGEVISKSEREWTRHWAKMLIELERALSTEEAIACVQGYSMTLVSGDQKEAVQHAMLVIKRVRKSKAQLRREALANWKNLRRKIIDYVRENGFKINS